MAGWLGGLVMPCNSLVCRSTGLSGINYLAEKNLLALKHWDVKSSNVAG